MYLGEHRRQAQDPAANEPGHVVRAQKAGHSGRPNGRAVCEAALGRHRNSRRYVIAEFSWGSGQPQSIYARRSYSKSATDPARLRTCCADIEFRSFTNRRRLRRFASPGVLGSFLGRAFGDGRRVSRNRQIYIKFAGLPGDDFRTRVAQNSARRHLRGARRPALAVRTVADAFS